MTIEQERQLVRDLRFCGAQIKVLAEEFGRPKSTISQWICDPDGAKARVRKEKYRGSCVGCGRATSGCNGRGKAPRRCRTCANEVNAAVRRHRGQEAREWIVSLWNAGFHVDYIAGEVGYTRQSVYATLAQCRRRGMDVVYRNHWTPEAIEAQAEKSRQAYARRRSA